MRHSEIVINSCDQLFYAIPDKHSLVSSKYHDCIEDADQNDEVADRRERKGSLTEGILVLGDVLHDDTPESIEDQTESLPVVRVDM